VKLGIFGGTFNPPHIGHLILAETAADSLGLDRVYFTPAADPPHKVGQPRAGVNHRLRMVELAIGGNPRFQLSRMDIDRPGPHYTADTVQLFQEQHPGAELYFLMGSDSLRDLLDWHRPQDLVAACYLVVMSRPVVPPDMDLLFGALPDLRHKLIYIHSPEIEISSTNIVARLQHGQSVRYRLPENVQEYIQAHGLYQSS
jgi:nicotinate-nucleotide adenylyltransferase